MCSPRSRRGRGCVPRKSRSAPSSTRSTTGFRGDLAVELMHGGRWAGHSLHAALSDLPIGFWSGALVLDTLGKDVRRTRTSSTLRPRCQRRGPRGRRGHGRHRRRRLDRERRRGPPRRPLPRAAQRRRRRLLQARVAGRPADRAARGPRRCSALASMAVTAAAGLRRRAPRAGPRRDGQPGGDQHRAHAVGQDASPSDDLPDGESAGRRRGGPQGAAATASGADRLRDRRHVQPRGRAALAGRGASTAS